MISMIIIEDSILKSPSGGFRGLHKKMWVTISLGQGSFMVDKKP
jgi:hypothetical protein